jgi:hypothetical protein
MKAFPKRWTMVQRDSIGYLIYIPCDGSTPEININKHLLTVQWQLESQTYEIKNIVRTSAGKYQLECYETTNGKIIEGRPIIDFQIKLVDNQKNLYLWTWITNINDHQSSKDTTRWIMIPSKYANNFRKVDNPCPTKKKAEKTFLPIEFD